MAGTNEGAPPNGCGGAEGRAGSTGLMLRDKLGPGGISGVGLPNIPPNDPVVSDFSSSGDRTDRMWSKAF